MSSEETLTRKRKVRGAHRTSTTRLMGQADTLLKAMPTNIDELTLLQSSLSTKLTALETIGRADTERIQRILWQIRKTLAPSSPIVRTPRNSPPLDPPPEPPLRPPPEPGAVIASGSAATTSKVKLPKISLPRFKGNPMYWTAFWDSYKSAIHLNSALSDVDKFNYLRSLLEKSAYDAIAGLTLSAANYREAIEILKKRFGN